MSSYTKPHLSFQQQLEQIKNRGLTVTEDSIALSYLERIGYYRLSAYWYPLREVSVTAGSKTLSTTGYREDQFQEGATFQHALALYVFDKRLRMLVMDAIERIEIAIRVDLAYTLGKKDPFAYAKSEFLHGNFTKKIQSASGKTGHALWLERYQQRLARANEDFVKHFKFKYGLPLPIWVSVELWDFGMLSHFYQGLHVEDKQSISIKYGLDDWRVMQSWLRTINHIRNIAAHHGRLWNKNLIDQPKLPKASSISGFDGINITRSVVSRVYLPLCILLHLLDRISPHSSWRDRTRSLLKSFPSGPGLSLSSMGCPADWELHWIWRTKT